MREVSWHLPGFCSFRLLNQVVINLMKDYPEKFREGYRIGSVYGTFPGAIWNGGRTALGFAGKQEIAATLGWYNGRGIPVRFTWTNALLEERHTYDTYCNLIMRLADNGKNQVLVNTRVLEDYIRRAYPNYPVISSTTKRITDLDALARELDRAYFLVVLDYDLNHDEHVLRAIAPQAGRVELLVNEVCYPHCAKREEHYRQQSLLQLEFDTAATFPCPNRVRERKFAQCMDRPSFLSNEQIGDYVARGFVNFKIAGRGMPIDYLVDSYVYYLPKPEYQEWVRQKINGMLLQFQQAAAAQKRGRGITR